METFKNDIEAMKKVIKENKTRIENNNNLISNHIYEMKRLEIKLKITKNEIEMKNILKTELHDANFELYKLNSFYEETILDMEIDCIMKKK